MACAMLRSGDHLSQKTLFPKKQSKRGVAKGRNTFTFTINLPKLFLEPK